MKEDTLLVTTRKQWRAWLQAHGHKEKDIWLIYHKKHTGQPRIPYDDAVEEALCFGWIDTKVKRIDDDRFMQRYTPRRRNSPWSLLNRRRAEEMIKQDLMQPAGMVCIDHAKENGRWQAALKYREVPEMPGELADQLEKNKEFKAQFEQLAPSKKRGILRWIGTAKKSETRERRSIKTRQLLAEGKDPTVM